MLSISNIASSTYSRVHPLDGKSGGFRFILILLLTLSSTPAKDVPVLFNHLTVDDGLSQNTCLAILEDSQGFMWVGTRGGGLTIPGLGYTGRGLLNIY
ncbi:MAG: hypothetical protein K9M55_09145 [Candidatus Marinimicrobia bacterium]|nr:hypothetical protein [Candidatus Neomarinimicrobiota bacterium]MCF7922854.1 hypothetical protein [Candidatus Neomarinimicrobiota bacterium]